MFSRELFAQRLYELRLSHKETQDELGTVIYTGRTAISEMERGKKTTTAEKIALLCKHYHVSADYLLGLSDDPMGGCERWEEETSETGGMTGGGETPI